MARRRPMRRSRSSTACCWADLENDPGACTQAPSQAALGVRDSSPWEPDGWKARADTVRAPTRAARRTTAVRTRERLLDGADGRLWRGAWRNKTPPLWLGTLDWGGGRRGRG